MKAETWNTIEINSVVESVRLQTDDRYEFKYEFNAEVATKHLHKHFVVKRGCKSREEADFAAKAIIQPILDEIEQVIQKHLNKFPMAKE